MRLVLFDMDHTLVPCDTGTLWADYLHTHGLLSQEKAQERLSFLTQYLDGTLDCEAAYRFEMNVLNSLPANRRLELLQDFFTTCLKPIITEKAIASVKKHLAAGDYVIMITATLEDIARPVAEFFGVDFLIGGRGAKDTEGNYTLEIELEPCMGRGKLVHLEEWLTKTGNNPEHYVFYSDSYNDLPLLEQVDVAIAVDPDDTLRAIAEQNSWEIISFLN